jgi:3'(2'), 5'-bisphosphate nucleotidase
MTDMPALVATRDDLEALLRRLRRIANDAGSAILEIYNAAGDIEIQQKADDSPLTKADLAADQRITESLRAFTPDIPVISEEGVDAGRVPEVGRCFWLVDPLDGTKEFISRNGEFTVNVALIQDGVPVAGVVHAPALDAYWLGGTADDGARIARYAETDAPPSDIAARDVPDDGAIVVASRRHGDPAEMAKFLGGRNIADTRNAGSSIKFCLIAAGKADIYPRFGRTMEWDTGAGHAVLRAAGGRVTDTADAPLSYGKADFANPEAGFVAYGSGV